MSTIYPFNIIIIHAELFTLKKVPLSLWRDGKYDLRNFTSNLLKVVYMAHTHNVPYFTSRYTKKYNISYYFICIGFYYLPSSSVIKALFCNLWVADSNKISVLVFISGRIATLGEMIQSLNFSKQIKFLYTFYQYKYCSVFHSNLNLETRNQYDS